MSSPSIISRVSLEQAERSHTSSSGSPKRLSSLSKLKTAQVQQALQNHHIVTLKLVVLSNVVDLMDKEIRKQFICERCNNLECCISHKNTPDTGQDPELRDAAICGVMIEDMLGPLEEDGVLLARLWHERNNEESPFGSFMRRVGIKKDKGSGMEKVLSAVERWADTTQIETRYMPNIEEIAERVGILEARLRKMGVLPRDWDKQIEEVHGLGKQ